MTMWMPVDSVEGRGIGGFGTAIRGLRRRAGGRRNGRHGGHGRLGRHGKPGRLCRRHRRPRRRDRDDRGRWGPAFERLRAEAIRRYGTDVGLYQDSFRRLGVRHMAPEEVAFRNLRMGMTAVRSRQLREMPYAEFLRTDYWRTVRRHVLRTRTWRCTACGCRERPNVHHTTYAHVGSEHAHLGDLIVLCRRCHRGIHGRGDGGDSVVDPAVAGNSLESGGGGPDTAKTVPPGSPSPLP